MLRLGEPQKLVPMRGERNYLMYIPLGVGVIIPPWNFPCAIMAGLVAASLVTGNTVVLKPASDSPTIAAKLDRKSTRLNSSHRCISYAVFCLKKKKKHNKNKINRN